MVLLTVSLALKVLATAGLVLFARVVYKFHKVRSYVRSLAKTHDLPLLPHSWLWGHLYLVGQLLTKYPKDIHGQCVPLLLLREYPELREHGVIYLDLWPFSQLMLAVCHPDMMAQFCQERSLPKHSLLHNEFRPFTQGDDLVNQEGQEWKTWREIFNPGFSAKNITTLVPAMLEEIEIFRNWLESVASSGEEVKIETQAMKATVDVIGRAVLGTRLNTQTSRNELFEALKRQLPMLIIEDTPYNVLVKQLNPIRPFLIRRNNRIMRDILLPLIVGEIRNARMTEGPKTINSLAGQSYRKKHSSTSEQQVDSRWIDIVVAQMKIFIFAGHDTTASALSWAYYLTHRHPHILAKVREEHDTVLGTDTSTTAGTIAATPGVLNQLPYTTALLKEALRLYPPAGSVRAGQRDFFLVNPDTGRNYPTEGWMLFSCSVAEQREDSFFPRANECVPERWFAREGEELHVRKNAFRAFELGPRNCIGQELAMTEMRLILALTVRDFDFTPTYPEDGPRFLGELGYQAAAYGDITAHAKNCMPMKISRRMNIKT